MKKYIFICALFLVGFGGINAQEPLSKQLESLAPQDKVIEAHQPVYVKDSLVKVPIEAQRGETFRLTREQIAVFRPTTFSARIEKIQKESILQFSNDYVLSFALPKPLEVPSTKADTELRVDFEVQEIMGASFGTLMITEGKHLFINVIDTGAESPIEKKSSYFTIKQTGKKKLIQASKQENYYEVEVELTTKGKSFILSKGAPTTFTGKDGKDLKAVLKRSLFRENLNPALPVEGPPYHLEIIITKTNS